MQEPKKELLPVAGRIVGFRNRHGWQQVELARRARLTPSRLSRMEKARVVPRMDEMLRIAGALEVSLDELMLARPRPRVDMAELVRQVEAVASPEEVTGIGRLLQLLLLGYQAARARAGLTPQAKGKE